MKENEARGGNLKTSDCAEAKEIEANNLFKETHSSQGLNMAGIQFKKKAIQFFRNLHTDRIEAIAFDMAYHGRYGFNTSLPNKTFTGYEILAWYYVPWALSKPEFLPELGLPFDQEYEWAKEAP